MNSTIKRTMNESHDNDGQVNDADLGEPTWIESGRGFPPGGFGDRPDLRPDPDQVIVATEPTADGTIREFTAGYAADVVAFTEFLAGTAFDATERDWLIEAMGREFLKEPEAAIEQFAPIANAVAAIPDLEPVERANNRHKALTTMYRAETVRKESGLPETPIMTMIQAHNPAVFTDKTGLVVVADALEARTLLNDLVLSLGGHRREDQPNLRTGLSGNYGSMPSPMLVELAGSQIRLVVLRAWLADLPQSDMDQLQARLSEVIDTATDLDLVTLQLSFRSMIEAFEGVQDHDD